MGQLNLHAATKTHRSQISKWIFFKRQWGVGHIPWLPSCFLSLGSLTLGKALISWRPPGSPVKRCCGEELRPPANSHVMSCLKSRPSSPSQAFRWCSPTNISTVIARETLTHGRSPVASGIQTRSQTPTAWTGPPSSLWCAETGCAMFSVTRNSLCKQWTNSVRSEDARETAKDTWSEGKRRTERLGAATLCVLRETTGPGFLLLVDKPQGSALADRLGSDLETWKLSCTVAGVHRGVRSLTKSEGLGRKNAKVCSFVWWPPFDTVFCLDPISSSSRQAGCIPLCRVSKARLTDS